MKTYAVLILICLLPIKSAWSQQAGLQSLRNCDEWAELDVVKEADGLKTKWDASFGKLAGKDGSGGLIEDYRGTCANFHLNPNSPDALSEHNRLKSQIEIDLPKARELANKMLKDNKNSGRALTGLGEGKCGNQVQKDGSDAGLAYSTAATKYSTAAQICANGPVGAKEPK